MNKRVSVKIVILSLLLSVMASCLLTAGASSPLSVYQGGTGYSTTDAVRVYNNADLTTTNGVELVLTYNSERFDSNNLHSTSVNTGNLTAAVSGTYLIVLNVAFDANATGERYVYIKHSSGLIIAVDMRKPAGGGLNTEFSLTTIYHLSAGESVSAVGFQNSGGNLAIKSLGNRSPEFSMVRIAA